MAKKSTKKAAAKTATTSAIAEPETPLIEPGRAAPTFKLIDQDGKPRRLQDYRGMWVVLYFYPKDSTPGCTNEACDFRDAQSDLRKRGAIVLGISPDDEKSHRKFVDKHDLNFTLLVDTDAKVAKAYGVWREKSLYGRRFMGVVRTTYLIDARGKVAHRWDKVKVAGHAAAVLAKIEEATKS